jgi:hypothetical protein
MGLSDVQQAFLVLFGMLLATWTPTVSAWMNAGMVSTPVALGALFAALLSEFAGSMLIFIQQYLGIVIPKTT